MNIAATTEAQGPRDKPNRLGSMLFLTALAHGVVILGITFTSGPSTPSTDSPSIKVTILIESDADHKAPKESEYIANRNELGGGSVAEGTRPTTALAAADALSVDGDPLGADLQDGVPRQRSAAAEQLLTRTDTERSVAAEPNAVEAVTDAPMRAAAMLDHRADQTLAAEIDILAALPDPRHDDAPPAPAARASALAAYLDAWRRRVERVGTVNFPAQFLAGNTAARWPTLTVAIGPDGSLEEIVVQSSSGDRAVDQAALTILRMAAPFDPLPEELLAEHRRLRFAYEWAFLDGPSGNAR